TKEVIFHENDSCNDLYILINGTASAFKSNLDHSEEILIKKFEVGDVFGEMSFLDHSPRSATIQSDGPCTMLVLQRNSFHSKDLFIVDLYAHIQANIAHINLPRLRSASSSLVTALTKQLQQSQLSNQFGRAFIYIILVFGIGGLFDKLGSSPGINVSSAWYTWSYLIAVTCPLLIIAYIFKFSFKDMGIGLHNWKKALLEGILISCLIILIYFAVRKPLGSLLERTGASTGPRTLTWILAFYPIHAYLQELIGRGILQTVIQKFFQDPKGLKSIFTASLVFATFHTHYGFTMAMITFFIGFLFGCIYIRSYNLIGVALVHTTFGLCGHALGLI
ncbi:MAG: CPBP family intramembrane metalloprotease, partial [Chlamydiia bacterium]|nr:CPBP family intramembrane metalloprotease [Chlamydiia bacterium]